jgi:hypothetical protein
MRSLLILFCLFISTMCTFAQGVHKFQSLFIYSFTRHIQWPDAYNQGDFEILILGETGLTEELRAVAQSKKVGDRSIKITTINTVKEIKKCNILFIAATKSGDIGEVITKLNTQATLLLTEEVGLGGKGSDINFIIKDNKPAIELNQQTINRKNLKVSSELSRLAILI